MEFPKKLQQKLDRRAEEAALRSLGKAQRGVDFSSNDYLGFSRSKMLFTRANSLLSEKDLHSNGATGSRLLSGNYSLYNELELALATLHNAEAGLLFNAGYAANTGLFASVPQRGDVVLYDEFIHASIRDGVQLSNAKTYKFKHNDHVSLEQKLQQFSELQSAHVYVVTESVFSMDGDQPDLEMMAKLCSDYGAYLIVDEAHALGVVGDRGLGLVQQLGLENKVFARVMTFGKAMGCHGAVVLGAEALKSYLVNFARSFIYTTGMPPHALAVISAGYEHLVTTGAEARLRLQENIKHFLKESSRLGIDFIPSTSAIQCTVIGGNEKTKGVAKFLQDSGYDVKPILSPTVAVGKERLRFCLHSYNTPREISDVLEKLITFAV
ncbi:8-amino-7-oxononanoate synthase [Tenacibaculum litopenaei]|uniref:aminotransferase class I/II-fold pyridoxal phosphate-dependent enzyme n=1 Tax=Tenacibaculum litopenaei TaxID=396016 RepID=UPI003894AA46